MLYFAFISLMMLKFRFVVLKRSSVDPRPTPEGGGTTPEGSLTLVSNLLLVVVIYRIRHIR